MEVVASGTFWDAPTAPANERSVSSMSAAALADGSVPATCRLESRIAKEPTGTWARSPRPTAASRGRPGFWASANVSGTAGRARRGGWYVAELEPG